MAPALCVPGKLPPQGPLLTNPPTPDPCREPAGCQPGPATYQVVPQSPQKLTLGFFTPLPLGCSSASCCFRGLLSARGVSTKLESWGSGVAFSPKGSDWRRETGSVATRASGLGVPVPWNPNVPLPRSYSLEKSRGAGMQTEHWALLLPDNLQLCDFGDYFSSYSLTFKAVMLSPALPLT